MTASNYANPQTAALVAYEHRMLNQTADALLELRYELSNQEWDQDQLAAAELDIRAYLESFLVHYRNLLDFLSPRHNKEERLHRNDVTVGPFLGEPRTYRMPDVSVVHRDHIDKYLAHISIARGDGIKLWRAGDMRNDLSDSFAFFLRELDEEVRQWFAYPVRTDKDEPLIIEDSYSS